LKSLWKIFGVVTIVFFLLLAVFVYCMFFRLGKPQITLIPDGYIGPVVIWFGGKDSITPRYEDGVRIYAIPPSAILREQVPDSSDGARYRNDDDDLFFYVKADGSRVRLPLATTSKTKMSKMNEDELNRVSVYGISHGTSSSKSEYFVVFVVGKPKDAESLLRQVDKAITSSVNDS
jgi:hypothetical protein